MIESHDGEEAALPLQRIVGWCETRKRMPYFITPEPAAESCPEGTVGRPVRHFCVKEERMIVRNK